MARKLGGPGWGISMPHDHSDHGDHHGHGHAHAPASFGRAFAIGAGVNAAFVALQVGYGLAANSMALLADAVHNLGDVLGLLVAWGAATLTARAPTARRTYGWGRSSILAALANAVVLLLGCGAIGIEALQRLAAPAPVMGATVAWVAAAGIVVNGGTALLFLRGRHGDLNVRAAFLHLASDAVVSLGVVLSAVIMQQTGWLWVDPVTSLLIVGVITWGTWGLLRQSVDLAMDAVPPGIDRPAIEAALLALPGVTEVHDLHIWGLSTTSTALTAHLVAAHDSTLAPMACALLRDRFGIGHATVQLETPDAAAACALRPAHVV